MEPLGEDEVHLWHARPDDAFGPKLWRSLLNLLSPDEVARFQSYRFERDRMLYLLSRAVLRTALSHYAPVRAEDWRFNTGGNRRPVIVTPQLLAPLSFSLSHTAGLVVIGIGRTPNLGVDAESLERAEAAIEVAPQVLSLDELRDLQTTPEATRPRRLLRLWTLKEAYAKARGLGLSLQFDEISFTLSESAPPIVKLGRTLDDDPTAWSFAEPDLGNRHVVAIAVRERAVRLAIRWSPDLGWVSDA